MRFFHQSIMLDAVQGARRAAAEIVRGSTSRLRAPRNAAMRQKNG